MDGFKTIVGKALTDADFCNTLVSQPEETLQAHGVQPTPEMLSALRALDAAAVQRLAAAFGKQQAAG